MAQFTIWRDNNLIYGPATCPKVFRNIPVSGIDKLTDQQRLVYNVLRHVQSAVPEGHYIATRDVYRDGDVSRENITTEPIPDNTEDVQQVCADIVALFDSYGVANIPADWREIIPWIKSNPSEAKFLAILELMSLHNELVSLGGKWQDIIDYAAEQA